MPASASASTALVDFVLARLADEDLDIDRAPDTEEQQRRRRDVRSRREVVASVRGLLELRDQPNEKAVRDLAVSIMRSLATPYADHPDFRDEWHAATR